ncbi:hypothetical protein [Marmoricola sp. RAF53]|uniref:hypothetical protein n=1 Tax=Marmoricola sp. RAF53 TaxID=3233059 RepID=UPI003F9BA9D3
MDLDVQARSAFLAFAVLFLAAVLVMTFRMDAVGVDTSAGQSPQNVPVSPTPLR